ncbi:hypothetical protein R0381_002536 [Jeongeupia wiesaeckerbachi]|uniref:hypothetical protein n=1 Tax=Jeongeupia wiesaeckerbachi TaxID=3051218 RepID=UPI003D804558
MRQRSNWVTGSLPKRGSKQPKPRQPSGNASLRKLLQAGQRQQLGQPLELSLRQKTASNTAIALTLLAAALLITALVLHRWFWLALATVPLLLALLSAWRRRSSKQQSARLINPVAVQQLDALLATIASRLPDEALTHIARIKTQLHKLIPLLAEPVTTIPMERAYFVQQLIARYLPDACQHYLAMADIASGAEAIARCEAGKAEFVSQLALMLDQLEALSALIAEQRAEHLALHGAFLRNRG